MADLLIEAKTKLVPFNSVTSYDTVVINSRAIWCLQVAAYLGLVLRHF